MSSFFQSFERSSAVEPYRKKLMAGIECLCFYEGGRICDCFYLSIPSQILVGIQVNSASTDKCPLFGVGLWDRATSCNKCSAR